MQVHLVRRIFDSITSKKFTKIFRIWLYSFQRATKLQGIIVIGELRMHRATENLSKVQFCVERILPQFINLQVNLVT